jgi:hypothetical protein
MTDAPVSRGEFEMLARTVAENARRLDSIDRGGTRGVAVVQLQVSDLAKDVAKLAERLDQHERDHQQDARDRRTGRRYLITTVIAGATALAGLYGLLADVLAHLH